MVIGIVSIPNPNAHHRFPVRSRKHCDPLPTEVRKFQRLKPSDNVKFQGPAPSPRPPATHTRVINCFNLQFLKETKETERDTQEYCLLYFNDTFFVKLPNEINNESFVFGFINFKVSPLSLPKATQIYNTLRNIFKTACVSLTNDDLFVRTVLLAQSKFILRYLLSVSSCYLFYF